ncbi:hypothetical protein KC19_2G206600 [Ceratodon purpureus]|uniref:Pentatricopeptide repeat-containing protein n=1 Tax=Ceratodon purpureus TaxID=3225 RepID=A0A8T0IZA3_CERPU|nr:hypothetical protein KC19_2G206600 [Ceratodon purpureus]
MFSMATSAFCYQPKGQHCRTESPNHVLRKIVGRSSPFQQGGWPRVSNAACLGVLRSFDIGISPYYHCVISRQDVTSKKSFYDVNIFLRGFCPSDRRGYIRALCQCNALPSHVGEVEGVEEDGIFFRRSAVQSMCDHTTTLERADLDEELLDEEDRITGALQIGLVGCRRSASWICFGGGARPRRKRAWKTVNRKGSFAKARKLVDIISEVPSDKEEIYGALDAFVAWELEFPIVAIKKAMQFMAEAQQWKRVIQVTKWMLSKGQGKTLGTYTLLLQALDFEGRVEEADALWEKLLTEHEDTTPRMMFTVVIAMFERHNQPKRLLQVFADMEELEIKPDMVTVERVASTYRSLGLLKRADVIEAKYPPTKWAWRYSKKGKKYRIRVNADGEIIKSDKTSQSEAEEGEDDEDEDEEEDVGDSDSDNDEFIYEEESVGDNRFLLNSDNVLSMGH